MKVLILFLAIYASLVNCSRTAPAPKTCDIRADYELKTPEQKSFAFYYSTLPVAGLNPAIWRQDLTGQLIFAPFSGCEGCLCYTFDHRFPIFHVAKSENRGTAAVKLLMTSYVNFQAINYRANLFKSHLDEQTVEEMMPLFGCDQATMAKFTDDDFSGAKKVQSMLLDRERVDFYERNYRNYKSQLASDEKKKAIQVQLSEEFKLAHPQEAVDEINRRATEVGQSLQHIL